MLRKALIAQIREWVGMGVWGNLTSKFSNSTYSEFEDILLPTLIYNYYSGSTKPFTRYLASLDIENIAREYPQISDIISQLIELLNREYGYLGSDSVVKVLGDIHPGGVTKLKKNNTVFHRKYPDYYSVVKFLAENLKDIVPDIERFTPAEFINKLGIFEREFVPDSIHASSRKEIKSYYFNLGVYTAVIVYLNIIDAHAENMIISMPYPVFFDIECMFSNNYSAMTPYTVNDSGIIKGTSENDTSVISGGTKDVFSYLKPVLSGTDEKPKIVWKVKSNMKYYNLPYYKGKVVEINEFWNEFEEGYRIVLARLEKIHIKFLDFLTESEVITRVVMRPTRVYKVIMQKYYFPNIYMKELSLRKYISSELEKYPLIYEVQDKDDLINNEVDALIQGSIPVYFSRIHNPAIFDGNGMTVARFKNTQFDTWKQTIENRGFLEKQLQIIKERYI